MILYLHLNALFIVYTEMIIQNHYLGLLIYIFTFIH